MNYWQFSPKQKRFQYINPYIKWSRMSSTIQQIASFQSGYKYIDEEGGKSERW